MLVHFGIISVAVDSAGAYSFFYFILHVVIEYFSCCLDKIAFPLATRILCCPMIAIAQLSALHFMEPHVFYILEVLMYCLLFIKFVLFLYIAAYLTGAGY